MSDPLYIYALRLLSAGQKVTVQSLAKAAKIAPSVAAAQIGAWVGAERNSFGEIVAYGITNTPTPTSFDIAGRQLYTWCALDAVVFPSLINQSAVVRTKCPATKRDITIEIDPVRGIVAASPAKPVLSIVSPSAGTALRCGFCNHIRLYADRGTAMQAIHNPEVEIWSLEKSLTEGPRLIDIALR